MGDGGWGEEARARASCARLSPTAAFVGCLLFFIVLRAGRPEWGGGGGGLQAVLLSRRAGLGLCFFTSGGVELLFCFFIIAGRLRAHVDFVTCSLSFHINGFFVP